MPRFLALCSLALVALGACQSDSSLLRVDATGGISTFVYFDRNGDRQLNTPTDAPAAGVRVAILSRGGDTVATATTSAAGLGVFPLVPVGSYRLVIDQAVLGDSLQLVSGTTPATVTVSADDTVRATAALGYRSYPVRQLRGLAPGKMVSLDAVVLHDGQVYGDSTLSVADTSGAIRLVSVVSPAPLLAGDSIRFLGRTSLRDGQPVLSAPLMYVLGKTAVPEPAPLTTALASSAQGGTLDAALVRVERATVLDLTQLPSGDLRVMVDDGSGPVEMILDANARIAPSPDNPLFVGVTVSATGILVPQARGTAWSLKPRQTKDLTVEIATVTVAEARRLQAGTVVSITGIALNGRADFGDASVHLQDASGAIRALGVVSSGIITAGDSIRVLGMIGFQNGQPIIVNKPTAPIATLLRLRSQAPTPKLVNTSVAASASGGTLDAALVEVRNALVRDTATVAGDFQVRVDDGTGALVVLIGQGTGIGTSPYTPGVRVDVTGLLVPATGGRSWVLKPRSPSDVTVR